MQVPSWLSDMVSKNSRLPSLSVRLFDVSLLYLRQLIAFIRLFPKLNTEDELVSLDELQEKVQEFDDYVQSTDVAAMQSKY